MLQRLFYILLLLMGLQAHADFYPLLRNAKFTITEGIVDERNHQYSDDAKTWCDWSGWVNGVWVKDTEFLEAHGIVMPDFSLRTNASTDFAAYALLNDGQKRQPTHTIEHTVYAIPGDPLELYPYYEMEEQARTEYCLKYTHWYDWQTGAAPTADANAHVLDFQLGTEGLYDISGHGYFALPGLDGYDFVINTPQEWLEFTNYLNEKAAASDTTRFEAKVLIANNLDFKGISVNPAAWDPAHPFKGTINGNGHTISNLYLEGDENIGFVSNVTGGCVIRNINFDSTCSIKVNKKGGILIGQITKGMQDAIVISNIFTEATIYGFTRQNSSGSKIYPEYIGGLVGCRGTHKKYPNDANNKEYISSFIGNLYISNCRIGGKMVPLNDTPANNQLYSGVGNLLNVGPEAIKYNFLSSIYIEDDVVPYADNSTVRNSYFASTARTQVDNCFFVGQTRDFKNPPKSESELLEKLKGEFEMRDGKALPTVHAMSFWDKRTKTPVLGTYATTATFLYPAGPSKLPHDYYIAADFSQSYDHEFNTVQNSEDNYTELVEPIIHFRHLFTIKDGTAFADMISASAAANQAYIDKNTRIYDAIKDKPLQVRLTYPYPTAVGMPSGLYYRAGANDYRRIGMVRIEVTTPAGNVVTDHGFDQEGVIKASSTVSLNRMLTYDPKRASATYDRLYVTLIGQDLTGKDIIIDGKPLMVERFEFNFLGKTHASLVSKKDFYPQAGGKDNVSAEYLTDDADCKYKSIWPAEMAKQENTRLHDHIDFDEYAAFYTQTDAPSSASAIDNSDYLRKAINPKTKKAQYWWKWPTKLTASAYAFGYDKATSTDRSKRYEYNEYIIANHSSLVPWNGAVEIDSVHQKNKDILKEGLYDIHTYETKHRNENQVSGFFYYINAASDPGTIATLQAKDICLGSTVKISAWIAEFSPAHDNGMDIDNSTANVTFRFDAVMKNGERVTVHAFVTGVEDQVGQWMHVYYDFTPRVADFDIQIKDIDHYELQIINNCMTSYGADYAVDDIQVYIQNPTVLAEQQDEICKPTDEAFEVKVSAPFENLLQVLFKRAGTNELIDVYYTFIDKELFDNYYAIYSANPSIDDPGNEAYKKAVVRYDYDSTGGGNTDFGTLKFNTSFDKNNVYKQGEHYTSLACKEEKDGVQYIVFNTFPKDNNLVAQKQYYISMLVKEKGTTVQPGWAEFNILRECGLTSVFTVTRTSVVKIDGDIVEDGSQTEYCENMQPTIQVNLTGYNEQTGEIEVVEYNAYFDWYNGSLEELRKEQLGDLTLVEALEKLRGDYPDVTAITSEVVPTPGLTQQMIDFIKELTQPSNPQAQPKLTLYRKSYTFPPLQIPDGMETARVYVLAIPIEHNTRKGDVTYRICTIPTQVALDVREKAPAMKHGFKQINYPARILDVPIRASLDQLIAASEADPTKDYAAHDVKFNVPVRMVSFSGVTEATNMRSKTDTEGKVYPELTLIWTNDPQYADLGSPDDPTAAKPQENGLLVAGEITGISATKADGDEDTFDCVFDANFIFKEGYEYQFRFNFEEANDLRNPRCPGQETFIIRVVPKYAIWIGTDNLNFNNDDNWRRISSAEALCDPDPSSRYYTDGANTSAHAFAPLYFTSVVIPQTATTAHLFNIHQQEKLVNDFDWSDKPSERFNEDITGYVHPFSPSAATFDVEYDLAAYADNQIYCQPWYANTCRDIHFNAGAEIIGQQWLNYNRAWVDVETTPYYWHLVASPLKEVYAGDLYLPTQGARQHTPLFREMKYGEVPNNRFAPAVYQRSYRVNKAMVYRLNDSEMNVAVEAGWSNVYNDVKVLYGAHHESAFSIKVDPTDATDRQPGDPVLFRLPKADIAYTYFNKYPEKAGQEDATPRSAEHYKLNDGQGEVCAHAHVDSRFFLVGNPLMAHLDVAKFLDANKELIEQKFWTSHEDSQLEGVFAQLEFQHPGGHTAGIIAPMHSFFVMLKGGVTLPTDPADPQTATLKLRYSQAMATVATAETIVAERDLTVTAYVDGHATSRACLSVDAQASEAFDSQRDLEFLDNTRGLDIPAAVYLLKDHQAAAQAVRPSLEGTELGVIRHGSAPVTLRFDGIDQAQGLALYDAATDSYTDIFPGMEYEVDNARSGLFIVSRARQLDVAPGIAYAIADRQVNVYASNADATLRVAVADTAGRIVLTHSATGSASFTLTPGIYILQAADGAATLTAKILVK